MSFNIETLEIIYIAGMMVAAVRAGMSWLILQRARHFMEDRFDGFMRREVYPHLIAKILFWPVYLVLRNPIYIFSETFFYAYGDPEQVYIKADGLKNFLNDLFRGKDRYKAYRAFIFSVELAIDTEAYAEFLAENEYDASYREPVYAEIYVAVNHDRYLFNVFYSCFPQEERTPSRYELDRCQRLTKAEFIEKLAKLGVEFKFDSLALNRSD